MGKEIEFKFLVKVDLEQLNYKVIRSYLTQTYLKADQGERRVRQAISEVPGTVGYSAHFYYTEKYPLDEEGLIREEKEIYVSYPAYMRYLKEADEDSRPIVKTRHTFYIKSQKYELDIYSFSDEYAILEIEVDNPEIGFDWPCGIQKILDVTSDKRFKNRQLAKSQSFPQL